MSLPTIPAWAQFIRIRPHICRINREHS